MQTEQRITHETKLPTVHDFIPFTDSIMKQLPAEFSLKFEAAREKFEVAGDNLFPCQADPKKCMYIIFP